jgi:DNA mismatch endonuclease (patch repair protein)
MTDIFTKEKRSKIMRKVKSNRNKSTELKLVDFFKKYKITGWRRNYKLKGNPDFVFPKKRIAVFTDGCFWHGHDCRNLKPDSNKDYWNEKIDKNKKRDKKVTKYLTEKNWEVIRIWECEMDEENLIHVFDKLIKD